MCSVVGYIGENYSRSLIFEGLLRLEYRGYDSAGFACLTPNDNHLVYSKSDKSLRHLIERCEQTPVDGFLGIGHTRWSTHGSISESNSHPQIDCTNTLAVVHNGIIENYHELKLQLKRQGHIFSSQTDTETIAHLLESLLLIHQSCTQAVIELVSKLEGAYAFICLLERYPDRLIVARKGSPPVCIGLGDNEMFIASDTRAFRGKVSNVLYMPDESFAFIKKTSIELYAFSGKLLKPVIQFLPSDWIPEEKQGYEHFMLKEIYEQKKVIYRTVDYVRSLRSSLAERLGFTPDSCASLSHITLIGCGTSWHAARIAQFFFEELSCIPASVALGSEFRYMTLFPEKNTLYIAISQSGETADTLESVRLLNSRGLVSLGITNIESSMLVREASHTFLTQAGHEIAVASTKAFSAQIAALFWLANYYALHTKHSISHSTSHATSIDLFQAEEQLCHAGDILEESLEKYKSLIDSQLAPYYAQFNKFIFLGRHLSYPCALEAALKLKEIAYVFVDCYPAGELKHGPLALIDVQTPIFLFSSLHAHIYPKLVSNAQEVKARLGHLVVFAFEGQDELIDLADTAFIIPRVAPLLAPLAMTGLMQYMAYAIAKVLKHPIDRPRNLAKTVTVE